MSRAQPSIRGHRQSDWQDRRQHFSFDDTAVLSRINTAVAGLPCTVIDGDGMGAVVARV